MAEGWKIVALDLSKTMGIAEGVVGGVPLLSTVTFGAPGCDHADVFRLVAKWAITRFKADIPHEVWIEEPLRFSHQRGRNADILGHGIYAIIVGIVRVRGIRVREVSAQKARKLFLGHNKRLLRNDAKEAVLAMCERLDWQPRNDNEADAACVWHYACHHHAPALTRSTTPLGL